MVARARLATVVVVLISVLAGALAQEGRLVASPARALGDRVIVPAGARVAFRVEAPPLGAGAGGQIAATRGGREVWNLPLRREGDAWTAEQALPEAGPHVLTARLFEGDRTMVAAVDLEATAASAPAGNAEVTLAFTSSSGRTGLDVSGWWGIAAMLVIVGLIALGTSGVRLRRSRNG